MKAIYLLIRTEKLSLLQTKASLSNLQSKYSDYPRASMDYDLANNLNNEGFFDL